MKTNSVIINLIGNDLKIFLKNKKKILSIYNRIRSLQIGIPFGANIVFDKSTHNLEITLPRSFNFYRLLETNLNNLLFSFNRLWHIKIKFAGKGFKIKRKRKTKSIKFYFYYSHVNVIILKNAKLKQKKKNRFIIKTWDRFNLINTYRSIVAIKNLNIYTKRGIRVAKQVVFRKTGKKSNY